MEKALSIEQCVERHAAEIPDKVAVVCGDNRLTYSQLWSDVCQRSDKLKAKGLGSGQLFIFRTTQSTNFLIDYMAVHRLGAVAVPIGAAVSDTDFQTERQKYRSCQMPLHDDAMENIADVLFTTGTTGHHKGIMLSYRAIMADVENLVDAQGFTRDTVFVICGPLNHIGSLSKVWPVLVLGGTVIILDGLKDMGAFFDAFNYPSKKMATFMVPSAIRMALMWGKKSLINLRDKVDFIETGGAAITQADMEALCAALPETRLYNTYASTETGIITTYDYNHNPCQAGCLGKAMLNSSFTIMPDGTLACGGKTIMSGYLNDDELTTKVLHDGMVFTSDLARTDSQGMLHLIGRKGFTINVGGYKFSPTDVESAALSCPGIADCVCCSAHSDIFGICAKLYYVVADGFAITKQKVARHLAAKLEPYKVPRLYEQVDEIKHLFNGKTDRKYYADFCS